MERIGRVTGILNHHGSIGRSCYSVTVTRAPLYPWKTQMSGSRPAEQRGVKCPKCNSFTTLDKRFSIIEEVTDE